MEFTLDFDGSPKAAAPKTLSDEQDADLRAMQQRAGDRAGGVSADAGTAAIAKADLSNTPTLPDFLKRGE